MEKRGSLFNILACLWGLVIAIISHQEEQLGTRFYCASLPSSRLEERETILAPSFFSTTTTFIGRPRLKIVMAIPSSNVVLSVT